MTANLAEGTKYDEGKLRYDLVPIDAEREFVRVLTFGASKYADRNWEKGILYSRYYAAARRHLSAWWDGEEYDPETGISHLAHALCCINFLLSYTLRKMDQFDDRPKTVRLVEELGELVPVPEGVAVKEFTDRLANTGSISQRDDLLYKVFG